MSLNELEKMDADTISIKEAAEVLKCAPYRLRYELETDDERPADMRKFRFAHCKIGARRVIARESFIRWFRDGLMGGAAMCSTPISQDP